MGLYAMTHCLPDISIHTSICQMAPWGAQANAGISC